MNSINYQDLIDPRDSRQTKVRRTVEGQEDGSQTAASRTNKTHGHGGAPGSPFPAERSPAGESCRAHSIREWRPPGFLLQKQPEQTQNRKSIN